MAKAIAPTTIPILPEAAIGWRRSTRVGAIFHAHVLGHPICGSRLILDRNKSEGPKDVSDMQYWGVCPRCYRKGGN